MGCNRIVKRFAAMLMVFGFMPICPSLWAYDFAGGTGDPNDPFQIATAGQLISIGANPDLLDKHFVLISDIDLDPNSPGGQVFDRAVIAPDMNEAAYDFQGAHFNGTFDCQGFSIANLVIDSNSEYAGLFGLIGEEGVVCQVSLSGGSVRGAAVFYVSTGGGRCGTGALAGENRGLIQDCHVDVNVLGVDFVGGLVGENRGVISMSSSRGWVRGDDRVGGLVGYNHSGSIFESHAEGEVVGSGDGIGGLVGFGDGGSISFCYSLSPVMGDEAVGGLVGSHPSGTISNCYAFSVITGDDWIGGLIGSNSGTVATSASMAFVNGVDRGGYSHAYGVGGLVGGNSGDIENCYSTGVISSQYPPALLAGHNLGNILNCYSTMSCRISPPFNDNDNYSLVGGGDDTVFNSFWDMDALGTAKNVDGSGRTSAQMRDPNTYLDAGWDLTETWQIDAGHSYPTLVWPGLSGALAAGFHHPHLFAAGTGEPDDPFQIETAFQLIFVGSVPSLSDKHFVLTDDIDLDPNGFPGFVFDHAIIAPDFTGHSLYGDNYQDRRGFQGYLDGQGYAITGLRINVGSKSAGLIGRIGHRGVVRNIHVSGLVQGHGPIGGQGNHLSIFGGLAGRNQGMILNCYCDVTIKGVDMSGGLVGHNSGSILNSLSMGQVEGSWRVGGLVGDNYQGIISNSYACGSASGTSSVGGLVGWNQGEIFDSYSSGLISGEDHIGGLVGYHHKSMGTVLNSSWDVETSGSKFSDGGGTGLTTTEMQDPNTYLNAGWDFENIWQICGGQDYPRLQWEGASCDAVSE